MIRVAVSGAAGRMGQTVCAAVEGAEDMTLAGKADPALGVELADVLGDADVVVDFSTPDTALDNVRACLEAGVHAVVGTTGFDLDALRLAAEVGEANCFVAPNFAIGAVLLMEAAQAIARHMPECEIVELHHDRKLDAPSGTAKRTAELIDAAGGNVHEPIHSVRLPGLIAHQEVIFGGEGQTLSLRHDSIDRVSFMPGVLLAVRKVGELPDRFTVGLEKLLLMIDATAQAEMVRRGEASPAELAEAAIARIEATNPEINAVIHPLFEEGLEAARGELPDGPFRGVPFLLKDLGAAFAGQPLHLGMQYLKERDFRAPVDTFLAQRFRDAGLVTIGKTNCPELGILPTSEPRAHGATHNPWDLDRSAGGSSGGSAAAVAAGMVPIAHANDGGGSIRIPAANCGLVGLKPSRQRTSEGPLSGDFMSGLTAELCVSRSVRDTAALLEAVHGSAPGDPYVAPSPLRPYTEEVGADPGRLRIALWTETVIEQDADPEVVTAARGAAKTLEGLGHSIEEPDMSMLRSIPIIEPFLVRWAAGQAQALDQLGMVGGKPIGPEDVEPLTWALAEVGRARSAGDYLTAVGQHQVMSRMIAGIHESGFDLLLTPTLGEPPPPLGAFDDSGPDPMAAFERAFLSGCFTAAFNATGQPAISLPLHWSEDGLPIGVQLVAPLGREDLLLRVASQLEQAVPWADRTAPTFAR